MKRHSFKKKLFNNGVQYLYHISHIKNIASIVCNGLLSRNRCNDGIIFQDISYSQVQRIGFRNFKIKVKEDIHDYVRLFFNPHTKMTRNVCFSQHKDHDIMILEINPEVMDISQRVYFTDRSCSRSNFNLYSKVDELDYLMWDYLTKDYDYCINALNMNKNKIFEFEGIRGAEVLIKDKISVDHISPEIIVKSEKAHKKLESELSNNSISNAEIKINPDMFPLRTGSNHFKTKMRKLGL